MKKNIGISIIIAVIFLIIGILIGKDIKIEDKNISADTYIQENNEKEVTESDNFILKEGWNKTENFRCMKMTEAIDINTTMKLFITRDNELYMYSTDKIFSNGENYKKIETDVKFQKFIKNIIVDVENNLYKIKDDNIEKINIPSKDADDSERIDFSIAVNGPGQLPYFNEKDYKNISYINYDFRKYVYLYMKDNNVYSYKVNYNEYGETILDNSYTLVDNKLVELAENEVIELFIDGTIKTNNGYYVFENRVINKEETNKYADIKPEYRVGFYKIENDNIISQIDKIAFLKKEIDTYGTINVVTKDGELIFIPQN